MSTLVRPFAALRPRPEHAAAVIAPPYDVVSRGEAAALAADRPFSFLHISRPEIDLPASADPYSDAVYAKGAENLTRLATQGILERDARPAFYIYRLRMGDHAQTGVALTASVEAYRQHRVRRHELTRPDKENDRVRNIVALGAQTGPVLCAFRASPALDALIERHSRGAPLLETTGQHGVVHTLWRVDAADDVAELAIALNALEALYIADGHHRSAAAARVADLRNAEQSDDGNDASTGERSHDYFLSVAFPHDRMRIYDYNRAVADLAGRTPAQLLEALAKSFTVAASGEPVRPHAPGIFGMYLAGRWHRLTLRPELIPQDDPVGQLDVSLLQTRLLAPLLDIGDPRTDPRIEFVGGVRGLGALERRVDAGDAAVAFALHPTRMEQLMAVADADELMPPKSTWFEPKLADGLVSHVLD